MKKLILLLTMALMSTTGAFAARHWVGGDISLLPEYEKAGAKYFDHEGKRIDSLLPWLRQQGMNAMRVRLFVNPEDYKGSDADPNACQSLDYIIPLCKSIKEAGYDLMLDFHYSDTWADPAKQWTPAAWKGLTDNQLYQKIYEYTVETLETLKDNGVTPDFIQPGNEISYGMLWGSEGDANLKKNFAGSDANWERLGNLLRQAIKGCRQVCPEAEIIIHTERVANLYTLTNFYDRMKSLNVEYDIIGLSYYPYFHGNLSVLDKALEALEQQFADKNIMIVETGYAYKWEVPGTTEKVDYPYSDAGQDRYARELVALLERHPNVNGLFWWWMEYNAYGTSLSGWYNAPLFDSTNGRACSALKTICTFADGDSGVAITPADMEGTAEKWYDITGRPATADGKGILISNTGKKAIR